MTMTARDNKGEHFYNRLKYGALDAIEQSSKSMCSAVFEYESDNQNPYITRNEFNNSNSCRGISHIMVTSKVEDMYIGGCVDAILSCSSIVSDHHLVAADFVFDIPTPPKHISQPTNRIKWGKISNIKVETAYEDDDKQIPTSTILKRNTPHTDEWKENVNIFDEIQKMVGEGSKLDEEVASEFLKEMEDLQQEIFEKSKQISKKDQQNGKIIQRDPRYKQQLENSYRNFKAGILEMAKNLRLISKEDPLDKMDKKIKDKKDFKDTCGDASASGTFTSVLRHGRHLRATAKALQNTAIKVFETSVDEAYKKQLKKMLSSERKKCASK